MVLAVSLVVTWQVLFSGSTVFERWPRCCLSIYAAPVLTRPRD